MGDRTLRWLIVGLLLAGGLTACHRTRQDEWDVRPASGRHVAAERRVPERGSPVDPVARGLFAKNCATCHGLDGSGQGPSVLDRPARNFKDGGFSFGNTADAIFNTISSGIPGTPMPAFADALAESDRRRLAAYVRTLGPPIDEIDVADTILTVTEESGPRIVRGILPPIVKGAPVRPRGLLVGLPGGLTFEYRVDDVRLLGVRQGGFVERTDWRDRGGTPLKPLGGLIWVDEGGDPPATFTMDRGLICDGACPARHKRPFALP
jgi:cytochrome c553